MRSEPKNVPAPTGAVLFLRDDHIIQATDLVRCTQYTGFGGYSDNIDWDSIKAMNWQLASDALPAWVGKTLGEFRAFTENRWPKEIIRPLGAGMNPFANLTPPPAIDGKTLKQWNELGYRINKGVKAAGFTGDGEALFTQQQVHWDDDDAERDLYGLHDDGPLNRF